MEKQENIVTPEENASLQESKYNFLTTKQVKKILKIGNVTCLNLCHNPDFPGFKVGKAFKVREDKFWEYFGTRRVLDEKE